VTSSRTHATLTKEGPHPRWALARRFGANPLAVVGLITAILLIASAVAAPWLAPYSYDQPDYADALQFPSARHLMGTDSLGRDLFSRILYGGRVSLAVGLGVGLIGLAAGMTLGTLAGTFGGAFDYVIMRLVDVMYAFPGLLLVILIMVLLGPGLFNVFLALSVQAWIESCRLTRGQILSLREREFVLASQAMGASRSHIMSHHLLPNTLTPLMVSVTLAIPVFIFGEAGLSFIGIGINPPTPSWGQMVGENYRAMQAYWHLALFPALMIAITTLAFTLAGEGLRVAFDPTQRASRRRA
jgi:oligopeptide transport system permease protein